MLTNNNPLPTLNLGFTDFFHMKNVPFNPSIEVTALCPTAQFQYSLGRLVYAASYMLLLFKSGINLLTRFGKTNPINFDKNLNSISGSLSNKKAA